MSLCVCSVSDLARGYVVLCCWMSLFFQSGRAWNHTSLSASFLSTSSRAALSFSLQGTAREDIVSHLSASSIMLATIQPPCMQAQKQHRKSRPYACHHSVCTDVKPLNAESGFTMYNKREADTPA